MSPAAVVLSYTSCIFSRAVVAGHVMIVLCEVGGIVKGDFAHIV
jgi:hypothetical protein